MFSQDEASKQNKIKSLWAKFSGCKSEVRYHVSRRRGSPLGNAFEILPDFWLNMYEMSSDGADVVLLLKVREIYHISIYIAYIRRDTIF